MSSWVHVLGSIRIDALRVGDDDREPDWDELIGREWQYLDDNWDELELNPDKFMPCGSEGSLQKVVWTNPNKSCLASYTVTVFGDLRDRDLSNRDEIIDWFKSLCQKFNVRDAIITVNVNGRDAKTWVYNE